MKKTNEQSRLPMIAPAKVLNRCFTLINTQHGFVTVKKLPRPSLVFMLPVFMLGFVFLALIIALLLTLFLLYVIFYFLISLPKFKKTSSASL